MPNWVYNKVIVTNSDPLADGSEIQRLVDQVGAEYWKGRSTYEDGKHEVKPCLVSEPFSFWNVVRPEGEDLVKYEESLGASGCPFWYDWNCDNWGTKWDACRANREEYPHGVAYTFDTAWSPPLPMLVKLSEQFPGLHLTLEWEEEQGFGGTFEFDNGEASETDAYDVPSSHAEYVERGKECYCEGWGEPQFTDCPVVETGEESTDFPKDELEIEVMV